MTTHKSKKHKVIVDEAASTFARRMLEARAARVGRLLRLAAKRGDFESVYVHQLRVATRRTLAVLKTFAPVVRRRDAKKLRRLMRGIRRAAGPVRDADVFLSRFKIRREHLSRALFKALRRRVSKDRAAAHEALRRAFHKRKQRRWQPTVRRCLKKVEWREHARTQPTATELLERAVDALLKSLQPFTTTEPRDAKALHTLRLQCKRLRYVLELCQIAAPAKRFDRLLTVVTGAQERLGKINDGVHTNKSLQAVLDEWPHAETEDELRTFVAREATANAESIAAFRKWWSNCRLSQPQE